jgi:TRAP-type transport system periplasmic protein
MITSLKRRHLLGAAAVLPLATPAIAQRAKVMRFGTPVPADTIYHQALLMFADYVGKASGGKLKVEGYPSGQLGTIKDQLTNVQLGTQAIAAAVPAWYSNFVKPMDVFTLPYIVSSPEKLRAAVDGPFGTKMKGMLDAAEFKIIGTWLIGGRHVVNAVRQIHSPADMQGLKIRVIGSQVYIEAFRALGANPVVLDPTEIYLGIQQKVVDGLEYPLPDIVAQKMYEVAKFITLDDHVTDIFFLGMNRGLWNSMSKEEQGIIAEGMRTSTDWQWQAQPKSIDESLAKLRTMVTVTDLSPAERQVFVETTRPIYAKFEGSIGKDTIDEAIKALS